MVLAVAACVTAWLLFYLLHRVLSSASASTTQTGSSQQHRLRVTWYGIASFSTSALNGCILRIGQRHTAALRRLYSQAPLCLLLTMTLSLALLCYNLLLHLHLHVLRPLLLPVLPFSSSSSPQPPPPLSSTNLLSLALPGINLPLSSLPTLCLAILISVTVHEAGHALAASSLSVRSRRVGVLWAALLPAAWVELEEDDFDARTAEERLRVVAAGVWHNALLAALCLVTLLSLPYLLSPAYAADTLTVTGVDGSVSPALAAAPQLQPGSRITSLDDFPVSSPSEWRQRLQSISLSPAAFPTGRCLSLSLLLETGSIQRRQEMRLQEKRGQRSWKDVAEEAEAERGRISSSSNAGSGAGQAGGAAWRLGDDPDRRLTSPSVEYDAAVLALACCIPELAHLSSLTCFRVNSSSLRAAAASSPSMLPQAAGQQALCLQAKGLIGPSSSLCDSDEQCSPSSLTGVLPPALPFPVAADATSCATAELFHPSLRLFVIGTAAASSLASGSGVGFLLFLGSPLELLYAVDCSRYSPRAWTALLSSPSTALLSCLLRLPAAVTSLLQFTLAVSLSLLALNALPVPLADGRLAIGLLAELATESETGRRRAGLLQRCLSCVDQAWWSERNVRWLQLLSTALFACNVALALVPVASSIAAAVS